ncbi:MAG: lipopolysaccharide biosynthesis protein [Actinomycetota bacterium]|nr:lipopolysaccharide biosynthesis protein [Solirubrobacterales bacterium]MDQ3408400.1 lipopolysaccharide biosynthesis protein [Actinomycetota bacterium]
MERLLRRLLASGVAYQAASVVSGLLALVTIPLYTSVLTRAEYGLAESVLVFIILASILLRAGLGEAIVRMWFDEGDEAARRRLARTVTATVLTASTAVALLGALVAGPLARALLGVDDATLMRLALLGLWAFTNLEVAYALLRVQERRRAYLGASLANVLLTVALTVVLVVGLDGGARGYVAGNYVASAVVLLGVWWALRGAVGLRPKGGLLRPLLRFGAPTVPADASVFALNVIDRAYLLRVESLTAAGLYAFAVKLATVVIIAVRAFQLAWPPLVHSVRDDERAGRFYAAVTTWYVVATGLVVAALFLLGRWFARLLAGDPSYVEAAPALPWVALGWALYGLVLVLTSIAGRAHATVRLLPAAAAGLAINLLLLVALVDPLGVAGAGIALCGAYVAMLVTLRLLTRRLFAVPFERRRLALAVGVLAGVSAIGELALPTAGATGLVTRALALVAIPLLLVAFRFPHPAEIAGARRVLRRD